jgi:hypothetical protein
VRLLGTFEDEQDRQLADDLGLADQALRQSFSGFEPDAVAREVRRSLAELDVELTDEQVADYARSISERRDYEIVLG